VCTVAVPVFRQTGLIYNVPFVSLDDTDVGSFCMFNSPMQYLLSLSFLKKMMKLVFSTYVHVPLFSYVLLITR